MLPSAKLPSVATCTVPEATLVPVYQRKFRSVQASSPRVMVTCVGRSPLSTDGSGAVALPSNVMVTGAPESIASSVKFES